MNALTALADFGQSPWLDNIRRLMIENGALQTMIQTDGIKGITSNPSIFRKAIVDSSDYDAALAILGREDGLDGKSVYERLALTDIRRAADLMLPVFEETNGRDGYVSIEVSPRLADDTDGTIAEARRLWQTLDRSNIMIKVPATPAGLPAIKTLISEGINVNVTLLFSVQVYEEVTEAFILGLEQRAAAGEAIDRLASVASFFVSRVDSAVDALIEEQMQNPVSPAVTERGQRLLGKAAIANAKIAYQRYQALFGSGRWEKLAAQGAQTQRLLWASTSTKNPAYSDVRYIEELIGQDTVNTIPPATLDAFRDHGKVRSSLSTNAEQAQTVMSDLADYGIDIESVAGHLLEQGVASFAQAFEALLADVASAHRSVIEKEAS